MEKIAEWMASVVPNLENEAELEKIAGEVKELCAAFPAPGIPV